MQAICHLAQKLSNFNSASGICCKCPCPVLHSDYFVEVAWKVLSSWLTALAQQQGECRRQDSGRKAKPKVITIHQRKLVRDRAKHHREKEVCVREFSSNEKYLDVSVKKYHFNTAILPSSSKARKTPQRFYISVKFNLNQQHSLLESLIKGYETATFAVGPSLH